MITRSLAKLVLSSPPPPPDLKLLHPQPDYLLLVPREILAHIFSYLPLPDIGQLCLTGCPMLRDRVLTWINTLPCSRRIVDSLADKLDTEEGFQEWVRRCKQFGVLCKKTSMTCRPTLRLELLSKWFSSVETRLVCKIDNQDWATLMVRVGLEAALSNFFLGWHDSEFGRVGEWLVDQGVGSTRSLRIFLWEFLDNDFAKASWLINLLQDMTNYSMFEPSTNKVENAAAHFLFVLLGPARDDLDHARNYNAFQLRQHTKLQGRPDWTVMLGQAPTDFQEAKDLFADLGKALRLLATSCRDSSTISEQFLISVIICLFEDSNWNVDNQAACLMFSSDIVVKMFLTNLTKRKGGLLKVSRVMVSMMVVCGRLQNNLNQNKNLSKLMDWCFTLQNKRKSIFAEFWKEAMERVEEGSMGEEMLVQLGVFIGGRAYSECVGSGQGQNMEVEE